MICSVSIIHVLMMSIQIVTMTIVKIAANSSNDKTMKLELVSFAIFVVDYFYC